MEDGTFNFYSFSRDSSSSSRKLSAFFIKSALCSGGFHFFIHFYYNIPPRNDEKLCFSPSITTLFCGFCCFCKMEDVLSSFVEVKTFSAWKKCWGQVQLAALPSSESNGPFAAPDLKSRVVVFDVVPPDHRPTDHCILSACYHLIGCPRLIDGSTSSSSRIATNLMAH